MKMEDAQYRDLPLCTIMANFQWIALLSTNDIIFDLSALLWLVKRSIDRYNFVVCWCKAGSIEENLILGYFKVASSNMFHLVASSMEMREEDHMKLFVSKSTTNNRNS